jgi:HTH-type transcriptional regulator/antitoxin HipB
MYFIEDMLIVSAMRDTILRNPEQLGAAIRLRRKEKELTQSALAKLLGAERKWVLHLESGNSKAEVGLVLRAIEVLGLRASVGDKGKLRRGPLRSSLVDQVFQRLQRPSNK